MESFFVSEIERLWALNNRLNLFLLEQIPEEFLHYSSNPRGGGSISYQFTHIYNVRFWKAEALGKKNIEGFNSIKKEEIQGKEFITRLLIDSEIFMGKILIQGLENNNIVKGYKGGALQLFFGMVNHDSHHRSSIIQALKHSKFKLPDAIKYGIWDINKI